MPNEATYHEVEADLLHDHLGCALNLGRQRAGDLVPAVVVCAFIPITEDIDECLAQRFLRLSNQVESSRDSQLVVRRSEPPLPKTPVPTPQPPTPHRRQPGQEFGVGFRERHFGRRPFKQPQGPLSHQFPKLTTHQHSV